MNSQLTPRCWISRTEGVIAHELNLDAEAVRMLIVIGLQTLGMEVTEEDVWFKIYTPPDDSVACKVSKADLVLQKGKECISYANL
jgi:hypothetical protein